MGRKFSKFSLVLLIALFLAVMGCSDRQDGKSQANEATTRSHNRLNLIKQRGKLICGINDSLPGFSYKEPNGSYSGISVDLCRAIAAVLFNDSTKVEFRHLNAEERFAAVKSGEVDILSRNTTWNLRRDAVEGLDFPPTNFYDSQGLLVSRNNEIETIEDLKGKSICVGSKTTSEANLEVQMRKRNIAYSPLAFEDIDEMYAAYRNQQCAAATSDLSELVVRRAELSNPDSHKILAEVLSKEPLGPVIANGQPEWFDVVEWVSYSTIKAEELGINSQNIDRFNQSKNPVIRRFLGMEDDIGQDIGLPNDFAQRAVRQVGNYGEIYERNIGQPFDLKRGINALWQDGGLIYAPPFR